MKYAKITRDIFKRHPENPILSAKDFPIKLRAVYNSAAIKTQEGKYVMLCRVNQLNHKTLLWRADSSDGIHFTPRPEPIEMPDNPTWNYIASSVYYDPRITFIDGRYIVLLACQGYQGCRVAMFTSENLEYLEFINYINVPDNRNMVIFPEKSKDGRYMRLERPSTIDSGGKGNIWLSFSPDLIHWGDSKEIIKSNDLWNFAYSGLGPSTVPIRTDDGWLFIFHAIMNNCTTREYSAGAAILDYEKPWIVKYITKHPVLYPEAEYEIKGLVEHVCFPCSKIIEPDGEVKLYYGAADYIQCLATSTVEEIIYACKNW
ncbi:MAG TPA: glycoside hydrolase family 130 protein [Victivallales bacterium]|nr:glycoside hydrolase family 130 protein [Victivallales bacterium]HRU00515.1 glycoside hydrolase family 130 protein [Victivallales bacterium]